MTATIRQTAPPSVAERTRIRPWWLWIVTALAFPPAGLYADVKLGGGPASDFEPVWASTPAEREDLLRRVRKHVRRTARR
jgi:hypothetical protein